VDIITILPSVMTFAIKMLGDSFSILSGQTAFLDTLQARQPLRLCTPPPTARETRPRQLRGGSIPGAAPSRGVHACSGQARGPHALGSAPAFPRASPQPTVRHSPP
jgi:hypothetical protein